MIVHPVAVAQLDREPVRLELLRQQVDLIETMIRRRKTGCQRQKKGTQFPGLDERLERAEELPDKVALRGLLRVSRENPVQLDIENESIRGLLRPIGDRGRGGGAVG
jgi:hypothetical protein